MDSKTRKWKRKRNIKKVN